MRLEHRRRLISLTFTYGTPYIRRRHGSRFHDSRTPLCPLASSGSTRCRSRGPHRSPDRHSSPGPLALRPRPRHPVTDPPRLTPCFGCGTLSFERVRVRFNLNRYQNDDPSNQPPSKTLGFAYSAYLHPLCAPVLSLLCGTPLGTQPQLHVVS